MGDTASSYAYAMYKFHLDLILKNMIDSLLLAEKDVKILQDFYLHLKNMKPSSDMTITEYGELLLEMNDNVRVWTKVKSNKSK